MRTQPIKCKKHFEKRSKKRMVHSDHVNGTLCTKNDLGQASSAFEIQLLTVTLQVLSLLRNHLLTWGLCQILEDLSPIIGVSWEFYFVSSFLPWDLGCAHFVDFTYGLYKITATRPAPLLWIYRFLSNIFSFSPFTISFIILSPTHSIKI